MLRFFLSIGTLLVVLLPITARSAVCVEDNKANCDKLGYTSSTCKYGGIACPFDTTKWYCAPWTCADGRLYKTNDTTQYTECNATKYKDLNCYDCFCEMPTTECAIGDVFYEDGTCSAVYAKCIGKQPIGVVYMLTDTAGNLTTGTSNHGRVISLRDLKLNDDYTINQDAPYQGSNNVVWGIYDENIVSMDTYSYDQILIAFKNYINNEGQSDLYDGKSNTQKLIATTPSSCIYDIGTLEYAAYCISTAAKATAAFFPIASLKNDAKLGVGNWYLPAMGELEQLYGFDPSQMSSGTGNTGNTGTTLALVNKTLKDLSNKGISADSMSSDYYWASTLTHTSRYAWVLHMGSGMRSHGLKNKLFYVRASLKF